MSRKGILKLNTSTSTAELSMTPVSENRIQTLDNSKLSADKLLLQMTARDLREAINPISGIVNSNTTSMILKHVKITTEANSEITFTTTDLDHTMIIGAHGKVSYPAKFTTDCYTLAHAVKDVAPDSIISFYGSELKNHIILHFNNSMFNLHALDASDYPHTPLPDSDCRFRLSAKDLFQMLNHTSLSMSREETRYILNGVYLHMGEDGKLKAVATDTHRLSLVSLLAPRGTENFAGSIISRKAIHRLRELSKDLHKTVTNKKNENQDNADIVELTIDKKKACFKIGNILLITKLIEGNFPQYKKIVNNADGNIINVEQAQFRSALERVMILAPQKTNMITISVGQNLLRLSAYSPNLGSGQEEIPVDYSGQDIQFGINAKYIKEVVDVIQGDLRLTINHNLAVPLRIEDLQNPNSLFVIMPMRL